MGGEDQPAELTVIAGARRVCDQHLGPGAVVVVAVSGGPDSVALLHVLARARPDLQLVVGHVRHGLRDDQADHDAAAHAAREVGGAFIPTQVDVGAGRGPEDAARRARYAALWDVVDRVGASALAVGHTMDDQAETLLLRLARGTGVDGLAGMLVADHRPQGLLLRPLLHVRRAAARALVAGQPTAHDPTNDDADQRRARARHDVLPALSRLHPAEADVVPLLARLARLAADDVGLLEQLIDEAIPGDAIGARGPVRIVRAVAAPPALLRRLVRRAWRDLDQPTPQLAAPVVDAVLDMVPGQQQDVAHGVRITRSAGGWTLDPEPGLQIRPRELPVPGWVDIPEIGARLTAEPVAAGEPLHPSADLPHGDGPLRVSFRGRAGDREARDLLAAAAPPGQRHLVPIIRDSGGRLLGTVPGRLVEGGCQVARLRLTLHPLP